MIPRVIGALSYILPALTRRHLYPARKIAFGKRLYHCQEGCNDADC
jgi:hypothetical protein